MELNPTDDDLGSLASVAASFPLLVYDHGQQPDSSQTMLSVADGSIRTLQVPELRNFRCIETPQGLVFMVDTVSLRCSLWNPETGEKMELPAMEEALPESCRCIISDTVSSPPDWVSHSVYDIPPDSLVLVCDLRKPELLLCRIRGGTAWVRQSYDIGFRGAVPGETPKKNPISTIGCLVSFADDPQPCVEFTRFDALEPCIVSDAPQVVTLFYLLESSKELFLVCLFYLGCTLERIEEVGVYVMDFCNTQWCKVTDIGDRAFLLGPESFAASCSAVEHGLKEGCVYFANDFLWGSNEFHVFDLKEGTSELVEPTQDIPVVSRKPFWLVPVHPGVK